MSSYLYKLLLSVLQKHKLLDDQRTSSTSMWSLHGTTAFSSSHTILICMLTSPEEMIIKTYTYFMNFLKQQRKRPAKGTFRVAPACSPSFYLASSKPFVRRDGVAVLAAWRAARRTVKPRSSEFPLVPVFGERVRSAFDTFPISPRFVQRK